MSIAFVRFLARSHNGHYFSYLSQDVLLHRYVAEGPLREGPVWASPRSRSEKDVADAKLEKTSLSADVSPQKRGSFCDRTLPALLRWLAFATFLGLSPSHRGPLANLRKAPTPQKEPPHETAAPCSLVRQLP